MKHIIKSDSTIYNSDMTTEEYKKKIIEIQKLTKQMWKNYYKMINKKK